MLEEPAEGRWGHAYHVGERVEVDFVAVVFADVLLYFQHTAAVGLLSHFRERRRRQLTGLVSEERQLVKHREKLRYGVKSLGLRQGVDEEIDFHYRVQGEAEAVARLVKHAPDTVKLVGVNEAVEEMRGELDGYLAYVLRLAFALLPHMLQLRGGYQHEVVVLCGLDRVTHNAAQARPMLYEIKLVLAVAVHRVSEFGLVAVGDVKAVFL